MNTPEQNISLVAKNFHDTLGKILNLHLATFVETTCFAVNHNLKSHVPGYQINDKFVWKAAREVKTNLFPYLNKELQDDWLKIEQFLFEKLGKDVEEFENKQELVQQQFKKFAKDNQLISVWHLPHYLDKNISTVFHQTPVYLVYDEHSGWGNSAFEPIHADMTFGELWLRANMLILNSGDIQNVLITALMPGHKFIKGKMQNVLILSLDSI